MILRPLWPLVVQPKGWEAWLPIKCGNRDRAKQQIDTLDDERHNARHSLL